MKLRIKGSSIRLRTVRPEVALVEVDGVDLRIHIL